MKRPYRLPYSLCPRCGYAMDAHMSLKDGRKERAPHQGDLGICAECGSTLVFDADLRLRVPTEEELAGLPQALLEKLFMARLMRIANPVKKREGNRQ